MKGVFLGLVLALASLSAKAADFVAGTHYQEVAVDKSDAKVVTEFFSFYCPHCYNFEPVAKALKAQLPADATFKRNHVNFLGGVSKEAQTRLSLAFLVADSLGKGEAVAASIFAAIHQDRQRLDTEAAVLGLLANQGIDEKTYKGNVASMMVTSAAADYEANQEKYSKIGALTGVPTFIVNDKYVVNIRAVRSQQEFNDLVAYLLEK